MTSSAGAAGATSGAGGASAADGSTDDSDIGSGGLDEAGQEASGADAAAISCDNRILDGDESDVDCGGKACPHCAIGAACRQDTDCIGAYCNQGICAQGSCVDKVKNLKETDVDCGGGDCPPCGVGASCVSYTDCVGQSCIIGKCQSLTCDDHLLGPGETDVDCGGQSCAPCAPNEKCLLPRDCASGVCGTDKRCVAPSCTDGIQNGSETDLDCGGTCAPCVDGLGCLVGGDCTSGVCSSRVCQAPSCADKVKNQAETDVDCGGPCTKCATGATCGKDFDCVSGNCSITCQPCPKDMVAATSASGIYCIDANEVTVGSYNAFLRANPPLSLMDLNCTGKTSYAPTAALDAARPTLPVTYVDWCDAFAYCAFAGRHLCGRVGRGPPLGAVEMNDASKSEWYNACSKGGVQAYPYGSNYVQNECVDSLSGGPGPVGAAPNCVGGFPGLHDMSGNVQEWEDNCVTSMMSGLQDKCKTRGGSYSDGATAVACDASLSTRRRSQTDGMTGFRCCR